MNKLYTTFTILILSYSLHAQSPSSPGKIPLNRQIFHDNIDKTQQAIIHLNSMQDSLFTATNDEDVNLQLTQFLTKRIDDMQDKVESDSLIDEAAKFSWLRGINDMLRDFILNYKLKKIKGIQLGDLILAYEEAMDLEIHHLPITPVIDKNELEIGSIITANFSLRDNPGIKDGKNLLILKMCRRNPEMIFDILGQYPDLPFVDSILIQQAYLKPEEFYNYASSNNALGRRIKSLNEPLVQTICNISAIPGGRFIFPFLDLVFKKRITIDSLLKISENETKYYSLLVSTEIEFAGRMEKKDTPFVAHLLTEKLRAKALEIYIDEINALHDEKSEAVRFHKLDSLTATELYYLCVVGEDDIYTSSYLGVYKRIWQRMVSARSDLLLNAVHHDLYKKFLRMAAAYNVLGDFLQKMDPVTSVNLMKNFVNDLEKNNSLEDAVDVADSYASISDLTIKRLLVSQVQKNYAKNVKIGNIRGQKIYNLLNTIFTSSEASNTGSLAAIGIPPMYSMPLSGLKDKTGKIVIQQFFYGDKDGVNVFNSFLRSYSNSNWKITIKPEWVEVRSVKGEPVYIYSNRPLDNVKELDAEAQKDLGTYLDSLGTEPTVIVHRGHSYYVKSTIEQIPASAKVILLGSCGGYHNLNQVLNICPGAHIIASKQVGTGVVNITLIEAITETIRTGKDLNWIDMWNSLEKRFTGDIKDRFDDYVPPHKNLGAIFIMAYNKEF